MSKEKVQTINLTIDGKKIIDFNKHIHDMDGWAGYENPFDTSQFMSIDEGDGKGNPGTIPVLHPNTEVHFNVVFENDYDGFEFEIDHIRLDLIGETKFSQKTPRSAWAEVLNLDESDGAIGGFSHFYLGQRENSNKYKIKTCEEFSFHNLNLKYSLCFAITFEGTVKYFKVDPLLRTTSDDD